MAPRWRQLCKWLLTLLLISTLSSLLFNTLLNTDDAEYGNDQFPDDYLNSSRQSINYLTHLLPNTPKVTFELVARVTNSSNNVTFSWSPPVAYNSSLEPYLVYRDEIVPFIGNYTLAKVSPCPSDLPLIIAVTSAPRNAGQRAAIRRTWARDARALNVPVYFVLGASDDRQVMTSVVDEDAASGDIVQWPFLDSYANLTLKSMLMLSWLQLECPRAQYALKTDDDMYLDVYALLTGLVLPNVHLAADLESKRPIYGFGAFTTLVNHVKGHSQGVPDEVYGQRLWPPFVSGVMYLVPGGAVRPLLSAALDLLPALFLEDVYLTGFAAARAGVPLKRLSHLMAYWDCSVRGKSRVLITKAVVGHRCSPVDLVRVHGQRKRLRFKFKTRPRAQVTHVT